MRTQSHQPASVEWQWLSPSPRRSTHGAGARHRAIAVDFDPRIARVVPSRRQLTHRPHSGLDRVLSRGAAAGASRSLQGRGWREGIESCHARRRIREDAVLKSNLPNRSATPIGIALFADWSRLTFSVRRTRDVSEGGWSRPEVSVPQPDVRQFQRRAAPGSERVRAHSRLACATRLGPRWYSRRKDSRL
jgi:hypothetical protein